MHKTKNRKEKEMKEEKRLIFLEGKKVILRPYDKERDLVNCQRWINDPELRRFLQNTSPITLKKEEEILDELTSNLGNVFLIIETKDGVPIGVMSVIKIDWIHRTAGTGAMIGEKEYWGKGLGTDAKMILLNYLFNTLNLRKINSTAFAFNKRSVAYNQKCGYKIEGIKKSEWFRDGKYVDEVMLAVFKKDWLPIWRRYKKTGSVK